MKKIRINELARELEVKAHEILERLPELGVTEKKTHSSSIDEDVAMKLRRLYGQEVPEFYVTETSEDAAAETEERPVAETEIEAESPLRSLRPRPSLSSPATRNRGASRRRRRGR